MNFGMFMEFQPRRGQSDADAFREGLDLVDSAERWGLDAAWLAEFHFSPRRSVLSSPIVLAGAIAGRTRRLRIGMAVYVLPLTHPLRIAEEVATLDHVSGGRLDLGVGRSGFTNFYRGYGVPYRESQARFDEALAIMRKAWAR
jgi:alkanesulfonate monooxygenase SsuD/methylene tetrahydromethanopterin reductase-like flavin-dependent oxidoreductase (luciferase family)